mgnify:FL=1
MSKKKNGRECLFDQCLETINFRLVKYPSGWGLIDKQGADLGNIESDRFDGAAMILDRLEIYIEDCFVDDIRKTMGEGASEDWPQLLQAARAAMTQQELEYHSYDLDVLDMVCNHPQEIDLENCHFTEEEEDYFE